MSVVHKLFDVIETVCKVVVIVAMVLMSLITIVEVSRRYILGRSYPWSEELVRYLLIWMSFLGGSVAWKQKGLVYFDLLQGKMAGKRGGDILDLLIHLICLIFTAFIAVQSWFYTFSPTILLRISTGLQISMAFVYIAIPIGFALMALFTLERLPGIVGRCIRGRGEA